MSWSARYTINDNKEEAFLSNVELNPETNEQYRQTVGVVNALIRSGALGDRNKKFHVSLIGHANTNHEPTPGWANDSVSITISQVSDD